MPNDPTGTREVRVPTEELGWWVRLIVDTRGEALRSTRVDHGFGVDSFRDAQNPEQVGE